MWPVERAFTPAEAGGELLPGELAQIVESVFRTMIGLEVEEDAAWWLPDDEHRLTAAVRMTGEWNGAVLFECSHAQAFRFAARYLGMETPAAIENDVVRDVMAEVANMIGGNLKCVLAPGLRLSTPSVVEGSGYKVPTDGAQFRERLTFLCADGPFWVTLQASRS